MKIVIKSIIIDSTRSESLRDQLADNSHSSVLSMERHLREVAYSDTQLQIAPSFFTDADMTGTYTLVVVQDFETKTPLLSCRYFYTKSDIIRSLSGDSGVFPELYFEGKPVDLSFFDDRMIFLADRLSGNREHILYITHRTAIFSSYHQYIVQENMGSILLLMVRKEPENKQLNKYLHLGFQQMGEVVHKSKMHTIIGMDFQKIVRQ